jgi:hypothetical protein
MGGSRNPEKVQDGGSDIEQSRVLAEQGPIAKQHSRYERWIDTVIAAPSLGVRMENFPSGPACG